MGKGDIVVKNYKNAKGYYSESDNDPAYGGRYWFIIEPLIGVHNERFFYVTEMESGKYKVTGKFSIFSPRRYAERISELKKELDGLSIHYYFPDETGKVIKREVLKRPITYSDKKVYRGGYLAVSGCAELSYDEFMKTSTDEHVMADLFIEKEWLDQYVKHSTNYSDLDEFFRGYSCESSIQLQTDARRAGALVFAYRPTLDTQFLFYNARAAAFPAFADLISEFLLNNGYAEASGALEYIMGWSDTPPKRVVDRSENNCYEGNYLSVVTYASLSDEEAAALKDSDETPLANLIIKKEWLELYVAQETEYASLDEFFSDYIYDTIEDLEWKAEQARALAFVYRPTLNERFHFVDTHNHAFLAFADFISGLLHERGYIDASRALDRIMDGQDDMLPALDDSEAIIQGGEDS